MASEDVPMIGIYLHPFGRNILVLQFLGKLLGTKENV
jgi:hypothetical protein